MSGVLLGTIKTSSGPGRWKVWDGQRWVQCWTFGGAHSCQQKVRGGVHG